MSVFVAAIMLSGSITPVMAVETSVVTVQTEIEGEQFTGQWTVWTQNGVTMQTGFSPDSFIVDNGEFYTVYVDNFGDLTFNQWESGLTGNPRTFSVDQDTTFVASFSTGTEPPNGGSCTNCQSPSIGITESGIRVVTDGLTVNGITTNALFYNTPFPLIQSQVGQPITMIFKIWDDRSDNIQHVEVGMAKAKIGESFNQPDFTMRWDKNMMTGIETITSSPEIEIVSMTMIGKELCRNGNVECDVFKLVFKPKIAIVGDVVFGVNIWDANRNTSTTFFNEGIQVGTEADIIPEVVVDYTVHKVQLRTDDGLGHVDDRDSKAFQMKLAWHNANIEQLVTELGY